MSETEDAPHEGANIKNISFAECVRYFGAKNVTTKCVDCGSGGASIVTDQSTQNVSIHSIRSFTPPNDGGHGTLGWGRPFFQTICDACGSMRQFDHEKAINWLKENPEEQP